MTGSTTAFNSLQSIPTKPLNSQAVTPTTFYTVPTGKRAIVTGKGICTGLGAAANVRLNAAGIELCRWAAVGTDDVNLATGKFFNFTVQMTAGQTINYTQNAGTNAEFGIYAVIQETI